MLCNACNVCCVCMNVCRHTMICKLYVVHMLQLCAHHTAGSGRPVDLFFVLDSSMSQRPQGFTRQKDLVANLTSRLNIGPNQTQVSLLNGVGPPPLYPRPPPLSPFAPPLYPPRQFTQRLSVWCVVGRRPPRVWEVFSSTPSRVIPII